LLLCSSYLRLGVPNWAVIYTPSSRLLNRVEFLPLVIFGMPSFVRLSWNLLCKRAASLPCIV
jgi:hypothetical protein